MALTLRRVMEGLETAHRVELPDAALAFRARLPGAFGWDQAAGVLRAAQAEGFSALDLLPLALPTSWMVNSKATSMAYRRWMLPPFREQWQQVLERLAFDASLDGWVRMDPPERAAIVSAITALAEVEGAGLAAVTKALALLRPQLVPLMDDAAIAWALDAVPMPETEGTKVASPALFAPMMDWFAREVERNETELIGIAARHRAAVLDAPQVLDRLLWFESWGKRFATAPSATSED